MSTIVFTDPADTVNYARIALDGAPNGGKTWTALTLAKAFGGTTALVDGERGSAAKYRTDFDFKHFIPRTFHPADLTGATAVAAENGFDNLIVDTWSPWWEGKGGMLEQVDRATAAAGRKDTFGTGWNQMRPVEQDMIDALLSYPGNVIVTLRNKLEYVQQLNPRTGKVEPVVVGLKPIQREGTPYEFDIVGRMANATLTITKTRCPDLFGQVFERPGVDLGYQIKAWLDEGYSGAERINPVDVRNWLVDANPTVAEIDARLEVVIAAGMSGAAVTSPSGRVGTLEAFFGLCRSRAREAEELARRQLADA